VHQIGCTYYSALNCDDDAYVAARAIQFFAPGVPQVYYVGLLAGENDPAGEGRAINRHNYSAEEIDRALEKKVVQRLLELIRFRNEHPAFDGDFEVLDSGANEVRLSWQKADTACSLTVDLDSNRAVIVHTNEAGGTVEYNI
jgi:sucrose phosphorylase